MHTLQKKLKMATKYAVLSRSRRILALQIFTNRTLPLCSRFQHTSTSGEEPEREILDEKVVDEIENIRDVSRLPGGLKYHMEHALEPPPQVYRSHNSRRYLRKLYARHGESSGVEPGIMWPTREELREMKEDEDEFEPTLQELIARAEERKRVEEEEIRKKEDLVAKQMERMPQYIQAYKQRLHKLDMEEQKVEDKRKALLEEARDFFGYRIDPRDPRFVQMQEMKAEEEAKEKKRRRKEEKFKRAQAAAGVVKS